ncbi:MAG: stage II sporulation protein P [Ruminiclostridium sp.]|nr:stage II sporulation protein P [Ruminiclostridium sp.]
MKTNGSKQGPVRHLRRAMACFLALLGVWMAAGPALAGQWTLPTGESREEDRPVPLLYRLLLAESALVSQWAWGKTEGEPLSPEEADEAQEQDLEAVTPDNIQEKTLTGGTEYWQGGGIALFNRTEKTVDLESVAAAGTGLSFGPAAEGPQVLIMHTHGTESFARDGTEPYTETGTAHTTDASYNIIHVGEEIARIFEEMGISVLHDTEIYDYPAYNGAYDRSRAGIEAYLEEYPTIRMVLDVHRDALVGENGTIYKPVVEVDGVKTAQVMLLVGTDDAGAEFPDWSEHLALAMEIQTQMNSLWPGLARPITLRTARFNQQLTKGSLLVEVGSHGNTLEEAVAGARLFARAAGMVIKGYEGG